MRQWNGCWAYLSLRNEEPNEDEESSSKSREQDESTIATLAHGHEHVGHSASDYQVEEPLGGSTEGNIEPTKASSRNLRDVNPADRSPTPLEEGGEEVDANKGDVARGRHTNVLLLRWVNADIETNVEHGQGHRNRSPE